MFETLTIQELHMEMVATKDKIRSLKREIANQDQHMTMLQALLAHKIESKEWATSPQGDCTLCMGDCNAND